MTLDEARRAFAEELRFVAHVGDSRVVDAPSTVPRERDPHDREDTCWLHGAGWCLSKR